MSSRLARRAAGAARRSARWRGRPRRAAPPRQQSTLTSTLAASIAIAPAHAVPPPFEGSNTAVDSEQGTPRIPEKPQLGCLVATGWMAVTAAA
eukprot:3556578-Pleurochrysis_carterae.AAC.3